MFGRPERIIVSGTVSNMEEVEGDTVVDVSIEKGLAVAFAPINCELKLGDSVTVNINPGKSMRDPQRATVAFIGVNSDKCVSCWVRSCGMCDITDQSIKTK